MTEAIPKEVIIIGAGPAGSLAAFHLARLGHKPLLLEKDPYPGKNNACGGLISALMQERLRLPPEVVDREIYSLCIFRGGKVKERVSSRPQYLSLSRRALDRYLAFRAEAAGAELLTSHLVREIDPREGVVRVDDRKTGKVKFFQTPLILFADGPATLARRYYGIGVDPSEIMYAALVYELEDPGNEQTTCEFHIRAQGDAPGYFWIFPRKNALSVGGGRLKGFGTASLRRELEGFIRSTPRLRNSKVRLKQAGLIPVRMAKKFSTDHALLLGDAAGLVNPLTGGGLIYAIISGQLSAAAGHRALEKKSFGAESLSRYDRSFKRTKYFFLLKAVSLPWHFITRRLEKNRYSFYPEMLRAYLAFSDHSLKLIRKL